MSAPFVIARALRGRECWTLVVTCPFCGKEHRHGGDAGEVPVGGHRIAHCSAPGPAKHYVLTPEIRC